MILRMRVVRLVAVSARLASIEAGAATGYLFQECLKDGPR